MGEEGTLNTRQGMGNSAAGQIKHSQDIFWQARKKTPGLVRHQRPGATDSYKQKRTSPSENVANEEHLIDCSWSEVRLVGKEGSGAAESC